MQQATVELLHFLLLLSTPSSHPPSLCSLQLPPLNKVPLVFSLKRAEANWILAGLQFHGLWLQGEGEEKTGEGMEGRKESGGQRKKQGGGKCCVEHFLKPTLTITLIEDGLKYIHLSKEKN